MSLKVAEMVQGKARAIAVSDSFRLAPWAEAVVSQDCAWWNVHHMRVEQACPQARKFAGPMCQRRGVERVEAGGLIASGTNSGLLACHVAVKFFGATRLLLCGLDMHGSHFFGPHPAPLKNTSKFRFEIMIQQFQAWRPKGIEILNCTPGSAVHCYQMADLCDVLG